ncbi:DUF2935 domain-containing protein [Clostridium cylindrosporum]|uniref:DUF2935 domain-containing protein n=1 Tax=Clostridium cylindrosporum DSM 605 TaxID=1121307 RepID=A0A0J8FYT6_CLOCY|nr:DUF2935 domain-containing protein [Clostridium cylindrosporum]KMT20781.1 hypothetical protein CLCY_1c00130 [Clostridium cylindrosporum DSM 605]
MKVNNIKEMALFEHRFWLQILGDHSRFILNALSPKETTNIQKANEFINLFDNLLQKSRKQLSLEEVTDLNHEAYDAAMKLREFKLSILTKQISGKINFDLPPTFVNHMLNELDSYICILKGLMAGKTSLQRDMQLHLLWLLDGAGHARAISARLDDTEKELINKSNIYEKVFTNLYLKSIEFNGYRRTGLCDFPALRKLNEDADEKMTLFKKFLKELEEGVTEKKVLSSLSPLVPDHMFREECYYLTKLSMVANINKPGCNPGKPRVEV